MPDPAAADPQIAVILRRPFAEQVAFFRGKLGNLVPTAKWDDLWKSQHDRAFMVAGAAKADLLADLAAAVDKAIADGETLDDFRERFAAIVQKHGWHGWTGEETAAGRAWRTRIIYQTNLSTSYAAGRLAQLKEGGFRLWVYRHSGAEHPRLQHKAWNGLTLPADHPFWQSHYPPNGWGCGCRVVGASGPETARIAGGKPGYTQPPDGWDDIDPKTGEQVGIDKGWGYMPGATVVDTVRALKEKIDALPQPLSAAVKEDVDLRYKSQLRRALDEVVSRATSDVEDRIEYAALIDADGGIRWVRRGEDSAVSFTSEEVLDMRGGALVHNHPSGRSLSMADLRLAATTGMRRIYAISNVRDMIYAATVNPVNLDKLLGQYPIYGRMVFAAINRMIKSGSISVDDAERWHYHVLNALLHRARIIDYRAIGSVPQWVKDVIDELHID